MSNENLMIEVVGSSAKAVAALDKVINKLSELQNKFLSAVPAINSFNNSLKSISGNFTLKNIINETVKASAELQKMESQTAIVTAKARSAMAKAAFDTENYAFKSEKLAKAKEKLAEAERKAAANAKWEVEAARSLEDAINRSVQKMQLQAQVSEIRNITSPKAQSSSYFSGRNIAAEMDAISRTISPKIDTSKVKAGLQEIEVFISSLVPAINNMSETAQNKFSKMANRLRLVNSVLAEQKQIYAGLSTSYSTILSGFGQKGAEVLNLDKKLENTKSTIKKLTLESDNLKKSMQKLASPARQAASALEQTSKSAKKTKNNFSLLDRVVTNLKTYVLAGAIYKLANSFSSAIQSCMNFTENMNLFNVSMGENVHRAGEFIDKMSAVFGMDSSNLAKTMGNFYQIASSMGMTSENAYILSENFTKLAADLSSFYNISMSNAITKLQAGLVGETEPLRRLGIIITENALKQTAANLGIQKSVESMSEAEKMHLRYITALEQTRNAQGDFARTIMAPAQVVKILKEQISQLARAIGSVFMPVLGAVLPYIIAFTKALVTLLKVFGEFLGYQEPKYQNLGLGFSAAENNANKLSAAASDATQKIKELKKQVMGFDELNILREQAETSAGKGGSFAVPDLMGYDNLMDSVSSKIDELYKKIMAGFKAVGNALEPVRQAFSRLSIELGRLKNFSREALKDFYYSFLVPVGNWTLNEGLPRFVDILTAGLSHVSWGKINASLHSLWIALAPFAVTVGEGLLWFWENVLVRIGTWTMNNAVPTFLNLLAGAINFLNPIIRASMPLVNWLWNSFLWPIASWTGGVICDVLNGITSALGAVGDWMSGNQGVVTAMTAVIGAFFAAWKLTELMAFIEMSGGIVGALTSIRNAIAGVTIKKIADKAETMALTALYAKDFIVSLAKGTAELGKQVLEWGILTGAKILDAVKTVAQTVATGALTAAQWLLNAAMSANPIGIIIAAIGALIAAFVLLWNNCEAFRNFWIGLWDGVVSVCSAAWDFICRLFTQWIPSAFNSLIEWVQNNWQGLLVLIVNPFAGAFKLIYDNCEEFRIFIDNLVSAVGEFFRNLWSSVSNSASGAWSGIKNTFSPVAAWFGSIFTNAKNAVQNAFSGIVNFFSGIWSAIKNIFTNIGYSIGNAISGAFKNVVNSVINFAQNTINGFIRAINTAIGVINYIPGVNIGYLSEIYIPRLAKGGLVTDSVLANIGEGQHDEAVLPLNDAVFERLAEGINKNSQSESALDEEVLYRAFLRALSDMPQKPATFIATLNNKIIAKEIIKEQNSQERRFSPIKA